MNIQPTGFETFSQPVVEGLLINTASIMEEISGVKSPREYIILHKDDGPMCSNCNPIRIIFLSAHGDFWGQWVYQFAHEYCHHLIDGQMSRIVEGLIWFEEMMCELASRYIIWRLADSDTLAKKGLSPAYPILQDYLSNRMPLNEDLKSEFEMNGSVRPWLPLLAQPIYHREHYKIIADAILPLFCTNPYLWRIIAYIGDSTHWQSLEDLLSHLESEMLEDCQDSLTVLKRILLG